MQIDWNCVDGRQATEACGHTTSREGTEPVAKSRPRIELLIGGERIAICIRVSLSQTLVESIGSDWVTDSLCCRCRIVEAISASDHRLASEAQRKPDSRREVVRICANQSPADTQPRLGS